MKRVRLGLLCLSVFVNYMSAWSADIVVMKSGRSFEGIVISEDDTKVIIQQGSSSFSLPRVGVLEIRRSQVEASTVSLPELEAVTEATKTLPFPGELHQIPATVIETGVLRNVPYMSFKIGDDVEVNVYGDPEKPGGIEIGLYNTLIVSEEAKATCVRFIAKLVNAQFDPTSISLSEDSKDLGDVEFEVTPPDAPDAYGGWWVSAYDQAILGLSRVSERELAAISIETRIAQEEARKSEQEARSQEALAWTGAELRRIRKAEVALNPPSPPTAQTVSSPNISRTVTSAPARSSSGRVWVRSYTRKDGTFVSAHSRRKSR